MADDKQDRDAAKAYKAAADTRNKGADKAKAEAPAGIKPAGDAAKADAGKEGPKPVRKSAVPKPKTVARKKPAKPAAKKQFPVKAPAPTKGNLPKPDKTPATATVALMASDGAEATAPAEPKAAEPKAGSPAAVAKPAPPAEPAPAASKPQEISQLEEKAPLAAEASAAPEPEAPAKSVSTPFKPAKKIQDITQEFVKMTDAEMMTKSFQNSFAEMSAKSQDAYRKSTEMFKEAGEFTKGNLEAMMESGKIFASGMQEMSRSALADSKAEFEALTAEVKEMASVKSPTDFFQLQSALLRKNFDKAVAMSSKNTEAMLKLANDASQPLSSRMSLAMEKIKAA